MVGASSGAKTATRLSTTWRRRAGITLLAVLLLIATFVTIRVLLKFKTDYQDQQYSLAEAIRNTHDFPRSQRLIDELIDSRIYNKPQTSLNETLPLTMRVAANPAVLANVMSCRPPQRLQLKARVIAPNFEADNSLDDAVAFTNGVQLFSWMLTPHQTGLQDVRLRGVLYCLSPQSVVTARQTVVDEIRAVSVRQPFAIAPDNIINLCIALIGLVSGSGLAAFLVGFFQHKAPVEPSR